MRKPLFLLTLLAISLVGCGGEKLPQEVVAESLENAMDALNGRRFEEYMNSVDYGCEIDSVQKEVLVKTYSQYLDRMQQGRGSLLKLEVIDVVFGSDTVCDVYYETLYSDSTTIQNCQKMVKVGDTWKIRARN